jgi:hypothetical protein
VALTSSSTLDDALAQYNNNLAWDGDSDKAALALEAIRWILVNRPKIIATNDRTVNFDTLADEKTKLEAIVTASKAQSSRCSFTRGRMLL